MDINTILTSTLVVCVGIIGYFSNRTLSEITGKINALQTLHSTATAALREYIDARLRENELARRDCQRENDVLFARSDTLKSLEGRIAFMESELRRTAMTQERAKGEVELLKQLLHTLLSRKRADVCVLPDEQQDM